MERQEDALTNIRLRGIGRIIVLSPLVCIELDLITHSEQELLKRLRHVRLIK